MKTYRKLVFLMFAIGSSEASNLRTRREENAARRNKKVAAGADREHCFCEGCNDAWDSMAGEFSCGARISWLEGFDDFSEIDACRQVAGVEHIPECEACNPDTCQVQKVCGNTPTCTMGVLENMACDESMDGCHSCGERIQYLISSEGYKSEDACEQVGGDFPEECGFCRPGNTGRKPPGKKPTEPPIPPPTLEPTRSPTISPSESPSGGPSQSPTINIPPIEVDNVCGSPTCTPEILDAISCRDTLGGCFTCGGRINYLMTEKNYAATTACELVAFAQFPAICGGCMPPFIPVPDPPSQEVGNLVWSEEFNYEGLPDPNKWSYDIGSGDWGWGNNELQYYTDRLNNAFVTKGVLNIRAVREDYNGKAYTSARLLSKYKGDWTYGRIKIRARLKNGTGRGTWPALWMLSTDGAYGEWPNSGEIDIMEHVGYDTGLIHGTVHTGNFNHMRNTQSGGDIPTNMKDWHVYEVLWKNNQLDFLMDGIRYHTFVKLQNATPQDWPFDQRFHLIMNMAVGGTWGGSRGVDEGSFQGDGQTLEVDWVRVYDG